MSTKYPQGIITPTPPYKSTTAKSFSGVWTLEQLANNFYYYKQAISKSLRFRSSASAYLSRTPASAGNQQKFTWSGWVKRGALSDGYLFSTSATLNNNTNSFFLGFTSNAINVFAYTSVTIANVTTTAVYRDPSAWYHIVLAVDTTQATDANRILLYINGVQITAFSATTYPSQNANLFVNNSQPHLLGAYSAGGYPSPLFDGYMAEVNFIDGQALDPSYFGQISPITGVWSPAPYVGSYGTNGFYLKFTDTTSTTTLCYDYSGNSNNWTPNNISLTAGSTYDSMLDSPTNYDNGGNGVGNYAVLNPLNIGSASSLNSGNLNYNATSSSGSIFQSQITASFSITSGKYYWEVTPSLTSASGIALGVAKSTKSMTANPFTSGVAGEIYVYIGTNGYKHNGVTSSAYGATYTTNDVIGVALDMDAGTITFYKNNTSQGTAFSSISGSYMPFLVCGGSGETNAGSFNFGQRPFAYTPPTGYKALNTQNLPAPSIQNGAGYMAATLYTGNGATQSIVNAVNGVSFQPDFVWGKLRTTSSYHRLSDSVRGASLTLATNVTDAEVSGNGLVSFDAAGFSMNSSTNINQVYPYVAWQWKAGGTAVTNTAGSITSSVSANTTAGFSVVTYTGSGANSTIGHGLGAAPSMIITKNRSSGAFNWGVYHVAAGNTVYGKLNLTDAFTALAIWQNTTPSSSVFYVGNYNAANQGGDNYVAYCFAAIPGYSAFGSYTGNGSSSGPFIYTGFLPRFILIKSTSASRDWIIWDTARNPYNIGTAGVLFPDTSGAEYSGGGAYAVSVVSNGFYLPVSTANLNGSGETMIYAAFAENPFNYSLAR